MSDPNFELKLSHFKTLNDAEKENILKNSKAENTNKATKMWVGLFEDYLAKTQDKSLDEIPDNDLPPLLNGFYSEVCKKKLDKNGKIQEYKTSTLKCIRAGLNRHFKATRSIDIITDQRFIQCNEMFKGVACIGKAEGWGEMNSFPKIEDQDMEKLSTYFINIMQGSPNPAKLQEIVLFHVIYYMAH